MTKHLGLFVFLILFSSINVAHAHATKRKSEFSNANVNVWKTMIYPEKNQVLSMHRHNYDRVLVALSDGLLKVTNDKGDVHYLKLKKNKAYYFKKDAPGELHKDENMTKHPITVMVIELKCIPGIHGADRSF